MAKLKIEFSAVDAWAAACAAQRVNGSYVKVADKNMYGVVPTEAKPNRELMFGFLTTNPEGILQEDREQGEVVRRYYQGLEFKALKNRLSDFEHQAMKIASEEVITSFLHIAVMASLPSGHARAVARDDANRRINWATGGLIGTVGDKVTLNLEVVKSIYSVNYNVHFITGVTEKSEVVFFSYREKMEQGNKVTVRGTIKAHRDNSTTQLTRTKVL